MFIFYALVSVLLIRVSATYKLIFTCRLKSSRNLKEKLTFKTVLYEKFSIIFRRKFSRSEKYLLLAVRLIKMLNRMCSVSIYTLKSKFSHFKYCK
jgi:hypothetical protein